MGACLRWLGRCCVNIRYKVYVVHSWDLVRLLGAFCEVRRLWSEMITSILLI